MGEATNGELAWEAVRYVNERLRGGASNRPEDVKRTGGLSKICVPSLRQMTRALDGRASFDDIREVARKAEEFGCGNCEEQSAVAFVYLADKLKKLKKLKAPPIEYIVLWSDKIMNFEHALVVVGRVRGQVGGYGEVSSTWNDDAAVCDPWEKMAYPARRLEGRWPGRIPVLYYRMSHCESPPPDACMPQVDLQRQVKREGPRSPVPIR